MSKKVPETVLVDDIGCVLDFATSIVFATKESESFSPFHRFARNVVKRSGGIEEAMTLAISLLAESYQGSGLSWKASYDRAFHLIVGSVEDVHGISIEIVTERQRSRLKDELATEVYSFSEEQVIESIKALRRLRSVVLRDIGYLRFCLPSRTHKKRTKVPSKAPRLKKARSNSRLKSQKEK